LNKIQITTRHLVIALAATWAAMFAVFFALAYVYGEHPAYIWDSRSYWERYFTFGAELHNSLRHFLRLLAADIWKNDNNGLPSTFILPLYTFFGICRAAYISAIVFCYLVPACLLSAFVNCRVVTAFSQPNWHTWFIVFFLLALFCPQFWAPSLEGLPDVIGCIPLFLFIATYQKDDLNEPFTLKNILYWGVLLWLPFLFRRWYAYTVVSLLITTITFGLFDYYRAHYVAGTEKGYKHFIPWVLTRNVALISLVFAVCVLIVQGGFVWHILHTPYADIYSAYQVLDWREHFTKFYYHFGPFVLLISLLGIFLGIRKKSTCKITLFALLNIALTAKLFTMTQAFTVQHYVPIAAWLLIPQGVVIWSTWHFLQTRRWAQFIFAGLYGGLTFIYFYNILIAPVPGFNGLLMTDAYYQRKLDHYEEYVRMTRDLESLLGEKKKVSVFSSNGYLCDSILQSLSYEKLSHNIHFASQVDKRDHFDMMSLLTDYVVVADPIQMHLRPVDQQVIIVPATQIINHVGIGQAYERLPERYNLDHGAVASIYWKARPFHMEEVTLLFDEFLKSYPEWKEQYGTLEKLYLTGNYSLGDIWGKVELVANNEMLMHPGEHTDTIAIFENPHDKLSHTRLDKISFFIPAEVKKNCPQANGVIVKIETDGHDIYTAHIGVAEDWKNLVLPSQWHRLKFTINNNGASACDLLHVHFNFLPTT